MLSSMRNAAQGVVGKAVMTVVMGLIIVSFVIWGVGDMLRGFTTSTVASVGGMKISAQEYRVAYDRAIQQYQRRLPAPAHQRGGPPARPRPQHPAAIAERSGGRRRGAQARPRHFRKRAARSHHLEPEFPGQVRRVRPEPLRIRAARHGHERARLRLGAAQAGVEAVHRRRAGDGNHRPQGRDQGGSRLPGTDALGRLFPASRFRGRRHRRRFRKRAQDLLQRSQVELPRARIPGNEHSGAGAEHDRQSGRGERRRRRGGLSEGRRQGSQVRRAREARFAADPVSQRGRRRGRRGQDQGRRELRRPRQRARPEARRHRPWPDHQGRDARPGRGQRRVRPAARGRQRRLEDAVRSRHRSRQEHHSVHGETVQGGRRGGEARRSPPRAPATRSRPCTTRSRISGCPAKPSSKPRRPSA